MEISYSNKKMAMCHPQAKIRSAQSHYGTGHGTKTDDFLEKYLTIQIIK